MKVPATILGFGLLIVRGALAAGDSLEDYWPIHGPDHEWTVVGADRAHPRVTMNVTTKRTGPDQVELRFSGKSEQAPGASDVEQYVLCNAPGGRAWIMLEAYVNLKGSQVVSSHPVRATKILFTPDGDREYDLIANGTYQRCGNKGQPYLLWDSVPKKYRIQVWGELTENSKFKWYWDAEVHSPGPVTNTCSQPEQTVSAVKVEEAWWSNFGVPTGKWGMGGGEINPDGLPSGSQVKYGRTVWHAKGQLPYYLIGPPGGKSIGSCVARSP